MQTTSPHAPNSTVPELSDPVPYCNQSVPAPPVLGPSATELLITQPSTSTTHTTLDSNATHTEANHGLNDILKSARGMGFTVVDIAKLPRLPKVRNARDAVAQFENESIQTVIDTVRALDKETKRNIVDARNKKGIKTLWDVYKRTISKRKIVYEEFVRLEKNWDLFDDKYPPSSHKTFTQYHSSISTSNKIRRLELLMGEKSKPQYRDKNGNYCDKLFYKNWSENGKKLGETAIVNRLDIITDCI
ncbi:hypothetical protein BKA69DRAFT_585333 [Paraphysoderma sedebokerense]|nr:hypothetical protein BKA69DRAFT_585333 [Paraphysoderma sedebokerense]